jgi:acyl-CoA thioesterase-1
MQINVLEDVHARRAAAERDIDPRKRNGRPLAPNPRKVIHPMIRRNLQAWRPAQRGALSERRARHPGTYRVFSRRRQGSRAAMSFLWTLIATICLALPGAASLRAAEQPVRIVALGDSLTAGLGLAAADAFPAKLEAALRKAGHAVTIANAGVSGDTASGGLARLDWSVPEGTEAVILELGANDVLRGIDPAVTRKALDAILVRLSQRKIPVLLAGMRAPPNLGEDYRRQFDAIYPELAAQYKALLYPFFLEGVAAEADLNQGDGLHPTVAGVERIVQAILPKAEELVAMALAARKAER